MKEFIDANGGLIATVVLVIVAFNALVLGVHKALEVIKDKTKSDVDNKIHSLLGTIIGILQKILELSAAYKPKEEEKKDVSSV